MAKAVRGQALTQTYKLDDRIVGEPLLGSLKPDFPLCEADFIRLTARGPRWRDGAVSMLFISTGYGISIAAKHIAHKLGQSQVGVESWEYWALLIGGGVTAALFLCSCCIPSARGTLLKEIKEHFETHPRKRYLIRKTDE
jgi:hypothetical protein